jgi:hypothetical protein
MVAPLPVLRSPGLDGTPVGAGASSRVRVPYVLTLAAAVVSFLAGALTWRDDGLLLGPPVMNGSARGTGVVVVAVAVPVLLIAVRATSRGSVRALLIWLGALGYLLYNAVMFVFATPYNRAFLLYVLMLSLCLWSLVSVLVAVDLDGVADRTSPRLPARGLAVFVWVVVVLNTLAWLGGITPALLGDPPGDLTAGMGVATNPVYVQDLAVWLPLATVGAWWLWHRRVWGTVVTGSLLSLWVIESVGIAVDQWFGHRADPGSDLASGSVVLPFLAAAVVTAGALWTLLRAIARSGE